MKLIGCSVCTNWTLMHKLAGRSCMKKPGSHACRRWVLMHERVGCSSAKESVWEGTWVCSCWDAGSCGSSPWQRERRCPGVGGEGAGCLGSPYRCSPPWVQGRGGWVARRFQPPKQQLGKLQAAIPRWAFGRARDSSTACACDGEAGSQLQVWVSLLR